MNHWTKLSVEYANQRDYLDQLFRVYPTMPEGKRGIDADKWAEVERLFAQRDDLALVKALLNLELFPVKDAYVAFLRKDAEAMRRNPMTVGRLAGRLRALGLDGLYERCSESKETNRQMGQSFRRWLETGELGLPLLNAGDFDATTANAVLLGSDKELGDWARAHVSYSRGKGLDLVARVQGQYVIGEAKFITDFGGHQNTQFDDAMNTLTLKGVDAVTVAVIDGVTYLNTSDKNHRLITSPRFRRPVLSALLLREFLYALPPKVSR